MLILMHKRMAKATKILVFMYADELRKLVKRKKEKSAMKTIADFEEKIYNFENFCVES